MEIQNTSKFPLLGFLFVAYFAVRLHAFDPIFYEPFDEPFDGRWITSKRDGYDGVWKHEKSQGHKDYGLLVSEQAKKYAIVKQLDNPIELKDKTIVLQFETRLQKDLDCGGAYLKYLRPQPPEWTPENFDNDSPYSIMFGPDKCGHKVKVHFILKHKNPNNGEYIEHHLRIPPPFPVDKLTHVYTTILTPDNVLRILIDGEEKVKANFLSSDDFVPPVIPKKMVYDPDDKKPDGWDDREQIPDPEARKPDDLDEDAKMEIEDEEAEKPEGWLDDEPEEIDDPESVKPDDWDDNVDGEWEALKIENPKCSGGVAPGCGEWKRPMKKNPDYKGKWFAPLIDNPGYMGAWKPREIVNPMYFEVSSPNFEDIASVGIEIWSMQDEILFDNILIAADEKTAEEYRKSKWTPKFDAEKVMVKTDASADGLSGLLKFIKKLEARPKVTIGVVVSVIVGLVSLFFTIRFNGRDPAHRALKATHPPAKEFSTVLRSYEEKKGVNEKDKAGDSR